MAATVLDGKAVAATIREEVRAEAAVLKRDHGVVPGLAFILVGENPASRVYVRSKEKACEEAGFHSVTHRLAEKTPEEALLSLIAQCNADPAVHGILVQLPLPPQMREQRVIEAIDYRKDVDGFHPINVGRLVIGLEGLRPCTPAGIQELLVRTGHDPGGKHVVIVGRSNIVGKPLLNILLQKGAGANAVVTVAHTGARDIALFTRSAEIVIAAIGKPEALTGEMLSPGVVVVDVGINRVEDPSSSRGYRIVGDVQYDSAAAIASAITPVPGGVGPMTIAMLMKNTLQAARRVFGSTS